MRVVEIRGYWLEAAMSRAVRNAVGVIGERSALIVEIVTDEGLSGWGETQRAPLEAWREIVSGFAPGLLGANPLAARLDARSPGMRGESVAMAWSALDIALWDLRGRTLGLPVSSLLGGARRDRVRAYASGPFLSEGDDPYRETLAGVDSYLAEGFRGVKLRCGVGPARDAAILERVREQAPDGVAVMADLNAGYSRSAAHDLLRRCEGLGLSWIEEPIDPFDRPGYAELAARTTTPIAAGESLSEFRDFHAFLDSGAVSILQPDLYLCGGFTGAAKIAVLAEAYAVPYLPHVFGSAVNFYASLQLAAVLVPHRLGEGAGYPWLEFDRAENPLRGIPAEPVLDADGTVPVPTAPGLGVEFDRAMFEPFARESWVLAAERGGLS